jgi:hypothetical protein
VTILCQCACYIPGANETDPPELTKRQAANLAVELREANQKKKRDQRFR